MHLLAERIANDAETQALVTREFEAYGMLISKAARGASGDKSKFGLYMQYQRSVSSLHPFQVNKEKKSGEMCGRRREGCKF
jgi:transcriptional accessory protein Tex/SPT6